MREDYPPEVLAEVARIEAQQAARIQGTTRNQRRLEAKLLNKRIKKHLKALK